MRTLSLVILKQNQDLISGKKAMQNYFKEQSRKYITRITNKTSTITFVIIVICLFVCLDYYYYQQVDYYFQNCIVII